MKARLEPRMNLKGRTPLETVISFATPFAVSVDPVEGRRKQNCVCGICGQLSHCLPDNIDAHRPALLRWFRETVAVDESVEPPGGINGRFVVEAAE